MHELKFTIPLDPRTKKNHQTIMVNQKTGKRFVSPSPQYKEYRDAAGYFIKGKGLNIEYPVNVEALYFMKTRRKVDLVNLHECLHDILVYYDVLLDDNSEIVVSTDGSRVMHDKDNPRTEVTITAADDSEEKIDMSSSGIAVSRERSLYAK